MESILDAAAGVFAETGFEAATMESIAERAKTSIGSLYQFFPNKLAVFEAVAGRFIEGSRAMLEQLFGDGGADWSWEQLLDAALDRFGAQRDDLDFRAMLVNFQLYGVYAQADRALHGQAIDRVAALARRVAPHLPLAQRKLVATVTVETLSALLLHSTREEPTFAKKLLEETKTLLSRYLAPYMEAKR